MSKDDAAIPAAAQTQRIISNSTTNNHPTTSLFPGISEVSCDDYNGPKPAAPQKTAEDERHLPSAAAAPTPTTISAVQHPTNDNDEEEETTPKPAAQTALPSPMVDAVYGHSDSVASDLSSSSVERSPTRNFPPAPPSTPASSHTCLSMSFDASIMDAIGPPTLESTQYAATTRTLEQEQRFFDSATPLPPRSATCATPRELSTAPKLPTDDFSDWAVGDRYELVRILGRGSYGEVAQAIDTNHPDDDDHYVAIKRIQSPFDQQVDAVRLYREIHILRQMQEGCPHECLIQLLDVVQPPTDDLDDFHDLYLVFECTY